MIWPRASIVVVCAVFAAIGAGTGGIELRAQRAPAARPTVKSTAAKRAPVAWDPAQPGKGLGYRRVSSDRDDALRIDERSMERKA